MKTLLKVLWVTVVVLLSCTKIETTPQEKEETQTRFCWVCSTSIQQKNYECGSHVSNTGSVVLASRITKCNFTIEEIRAYETNMADFISVTVNGNKCINGHPQEMYTKETKVVCVKQ